MRRYWRRHGPAVVLVAGAVMAAVGFGLVNAALGLVVGGLEAMGLAVLEMLSGGDGGDED